MDKDQNNNQDELEHKISEGEMEAQQDEIAPQVEPVSSFEPEAVETEEEQAPAPKKGLSPARKVWRRILIWLVVIALAFAGGFFVDTVMRYQPEVQRAENLQADLEEAEAEIASLEVEIERLSQFEDQNRALTEQVRSLETRLLVLSARTAVADAALAVEKDQEADARLALDKLGTTLQTLKSRLNAEQAEVVDNMVQRLQLVLIELENEDYSVDTDLELLSTRLITLDNNLFASP